MAGKVAEYCAKNGISKSDIDFELFNKVFKVRTIASVMCERDDLERLESEAIAKFRQENPDRLLLNVCKNGAFGKSKKTKTSIEEPIVQHPAI